MVMAKPNLGTLGKRARRLCNGKDILRRTIPVVTWLPNYTLSLFMQDLLAGITVGLTEVPQSIAYAIVAGLPSQYGLYSGFMGGFVYFILGSCKDINIGPTAIMAVMIQPYVTSMGAAGAVLLCFLSGCIIFLLGLLHLGFLVKFFSYPVISGFTTAAALNIASGQLKSLLGISGKSDKFLEAWITVIEHIKETRKWDLTLGLITIAFLFFAKEMRKYGSLAHRDDWSKNRNIAGKFIFLFSLAATAIAVVVGTTMGYFFEKNGMTPFKLTGDVKGGLPGFDLPPFNTSFNGTEFNFIDMVNEYGTIVIFCPLVAILEHVAIAKAFSKGRTLDATQELMALGISNILGSFVHSMPITGSFTRTAVNNASGVKTTGAGVITGIIVLFALGFLTATFQYIPKSTLAAVIIVAMYYLCDFQAFPLLWRSKKLDLIPLLATLLGGLLLSLEYGILIGIGTNLTFILYSAARPKFTIEESATPEGRVYVFKTKTGLHFAAAEYMRENILENCVEEKSTVVVDGRCLGNIDATVARNFGVLREELEIRNQKLILMNFKPSVKAICMGAVPKLEDHFKDDNEKGCEVPRIPRAQYTKTSEE